VPLWLADAPLRDRFWLMMTTFRFRKISTQDASQLQPIHTRHGDIQEHDGRPQGLRFFNALDSVCRFAADAPLRATGKPLSKSASDGLMIVHDEDNAKHYLSPEEYTAGTSSRPAETLICSKPYGRNAVTLNGFFRPPILAGERRERIYSVHCTQAGIASFLGQNRLPPRPQERGFLLRLRLGSISLR